MVPSVLDICLPEESFGDILTVVNRLTDMGVVEDDDGDLSLNYADSTLGEMTEEEYVADVRRRLSDLSREIVRLIGSGISEYDFLHSHFPTVPPYVFLWVIDKLLEEGAVIRQPDGELILGC